MGVWDSTIGCVVLAAMVSCLVQGLQLASATSYVIDFWASDRWIFKALVAWVTVISLVNTAAACHAAYDWTVLNFGDPTHLATIPWGLGVALFCLSLTALPVQHFFAYRLWVLLGRRMGFINVGLPVLICLLSWTSFAFCFGGAIWIWVHPTFVELADYRTKVYAWCASACLCDAVITISISYALYTAKSDFGRSNQIINRLIFLMAETNATSFCLAIATVVLLVVLDGELWYYIVDSALAMVYALALTVSLNARTQLAKIVDQTHAYGSWEAQSGARRGFKRALPGHGVEVTVDRHLTEDRNAGEPVKVNFEINDSMELQKV